MILLNDVRAGCPAGSEVIYDSDAESFDIRLPGQLTWLPLSRQAVEEHASWLTVWVRLQLGQLQRSAAKR